MKAAFCLLPLALAACDSSPTIEARNASVADVAEKVRRTTGDEGYLRAGKWLSKATIEDFSAPGMPPGMADNMKAMMASKPGTETCMTEADVKKPNADFFASQNKNCRYDHFKMGDGKIDARMQCSTGGATQRMTMAGTYAPDQYQMRMTTEMEPGKSAAAMGAMTMKMHVEGKRIGDCDAGDTKQS